MKCYLCVLDAVLIRKKTDSRHHSWPEKQFEKELAFKSAL
jgi:hypothetical protein